MTATEIQNDSPEYRSRRRREYYQAANVYNLELSRLYSLAPMPGFKQWKEGNITHWESLPLEPKWQEAIDRVTKLRDEYLKSNFPEFYVD